MIQIDKITDNHFNNTINNYEKRLKKNTPDFKLSDFERLLMKEAMIYGYEYAQFELKTNINNK